METSTVVRRRTRLSPEARRIQLMDCAIDVFAKRGLGRAGHAEIAEIAQVSVATVFNYFSTREELVDHVLSTVEDFFLNLVENSFNNQSLTTPQSIHHYFNTFIDTAMNQSAYTYIWLEWSSSIQGEIWERYLKLLNQMMSCISSKITQSIEQGEHFNETLSVDELSRSLCNQGYVILQLVNQPKPMHKNEILHFMEKYITATLLTN